MKIATMSLCALIVAGCTTNLAVTRVDVDKPATRAGIPYPLTFSRYEIEIVRHVIDCKDGITISVKADIKGTTATPDPKNLFVINPNSLSSSLKTSDVLLKYSAITGSPSALNASAEDRTAQVIANIASTAVSIAKFIAIPGAPKAAGGPKAAHCTEAASDALKAANTFTNEVNAARELVDRRTEELKAIQDKLAAMGANADEPTKQAFGKAYSALLTATEQLADKTAKLEKALAPVVDKRSIFWPENGDQGSGSNDLMSDVFERWTGYPPDPDQLRKVHVEYLLQRVGSEGRDLAVLDPVDPSLGIPVRQPSKGTLSICAPDCTQRTIAKKTEEVLQLGYVYYLPCESRAFSSIICTFEIADSGRLTSMGRASKVATAEALTGALQGAVDKATEIKQIRADAATKRLEAETAYLKALADRDAAAAAIQTEDLKGNASAEAALKSSTALLDAKRAQIEARNALEAVRSQRP